MDRLVGKSLQGGQYTLTELLGRGGFGITFKATHHFLQETYVIKTLNPEFQDDPQFPELAEKFRDEAKRLKLCEHPNIVRMRDFFVENGVPYLVMDYIPGRSLEQVVFPHHPLSEAIAVHYIRQIGSALELVHQKGLLHRDLKPENIILRDHTDQVVLIDFGIAREFVPGKTQAHTNLVTVGYAPVEQYMLKAKRSPATDIYALAATLYAMVTAQVPVASIMRDRQTMPEPRIINPRLSPALNQAILRGMALEIEQRPRTVTDWMALLPASTTLAHATGTAAGSELSTAATIAVSPQSPSPRPVQPTPPAPRRPVPAPSTAATLAVSPPAATARSAAQSIAPSTRRSPTPATPPARRGRGLLLLGLVSLSSMAIAAVGTVLYHSSQTAPPAADTAPAEVIAETPVASEPEVLPPSEPEVPPTPEAEAPAPARPFPPGIFGRADRQEDSRAEEQEEEQEERANQDNSAAAEPSAPPNRSSTSAPIRSVPGFPPGVQEQAVVERLGQPAEVRAGDGSGLRTTVYIFPDQVDLVYIYDQQTDRLRQTEAYFTPYMDFNVMRTALNGMLESGLNPEIEQGLEAVRQGEADSYGIETPQFQGIIERSGDRIYVGVWQR